jgi:ATP-dependent RNA helicase SUPV3L1/SUV3
MMADHKTPPAASSEPQGHPECSRTVTAVLGPTNTGKTHLAIERMLGYETGVIGLPLRLLAREVYDKIARRIGADKVALITGEEKVKPEDPRYYVCTVEAMPRDLDVDFLAVDEVQLAGDPERGHVFTNRLFHSRGKLETLLLGAATMQGVIRDLLPDANFVTRPRLSKLSYSGQKKISRLPRRCAVVAFSANDVYAIAELIRRQRGGAAVVLGALSPRTRNAQVELYQSGDVDFLVATDAIGMGLNLDVDHVAFAGLRKYDGHVHRSLTPSEIAQIAGRAGRHMNDGMFGVTGETEPFSAELVERLENHDFEPVKILQWRNSQLDFSSLERLKRSLRQTPSARQLQRTRANDDVIVLETLSADDEIADLARSSHAVEKLWDTCQVPDYRKISASSHAELVANIFKYLVSDAGVIPEDWVARQVAHAASTEGDIDTLASRISLIRTWTFISNRRDWLAEPDMWQARTREIEDNLSDAMHQQLAQRFVDRRTSVLMKRLHDKALLHAEFEDDGRIFVESHYVGRLEGFRFTPDTQAAGAQGKAARHAASKILVRELSDRAERLCAAKPDAFALSRNGVIHWAGQSVARLEAGENPLRPNFELMADEQLNAPDRERVTNRLRTWLDYHISQRLRPLLDLSNAADLGGPSRGIAFRLVEGFGAITREAVADEVRNLDQVARAQLRKYGVRFGAYNIFFPALLKPDAAELVQTLWMLRHGQDHGLSRLQPPEPPRAGLTSLNADTSLPEGFYRACGFHLCATRAVRIDILERLGDQLRPLISWKPSADKTEPPAGALGGGAFKVQPEMMSILGCSADELALVLKAIGYRLERRPVARPGVDGQAHAEVLGSDPPIPVEAAPAAPEAAAPTQADPAAAVPAEAESPALDAPALDAAALEVAPPEVAPPESVPAAAEPEYEEIWRLRRRAHRDKRPNPRRAEKAETASGSDAAAQLPRNKADGERKPRQDDRPRQGHRHDRHKDKDRHQDRRGARIAPARSDQPAAASARANVRRAVDPNSPFAALQSLKEKLESKVEQKVVDHAQDQA